MDISTDFTVFYVTLSILGPFIIGINGLVIYLVLTREYLKTVTNCCLASLAVSDMLSGLYAVPLIITCNSLGTMNICVAMDLSQRFLAISTVLHLLLITMERYFTIVFSAMRTTSVISKRTCLAVLVLVWTLSLFASLIQLSFMGDKTQEPSVKDIIYDFTCLGLLVVFPLVTMTVAHIHIFYTLRKHCKRIKRDVSHLSSECMEKNAKKERRALIIYGTMICVFIVGWFSYFFRTLQNDLGNRSRIPLWAEAILILLKFSTGFFNPLLYTFFKQDFRRARKSLHFFGWRERTSSFQRKSSTASSTRRTHLSSASFADHVVSSVWFRLLVGISIKNFFPAKIITFTKSFPAALFHELWTLPSLARFPPLSRARSPGNRARNYHMKVTVLY